MAGQQQQHGPGAASCLTPDVWVTQLQELVVLASIYPHDIRYYSSNARHACITNTCHTSFLAWARTNKHSTRIQACTAHAGAFHACGMCVWLGGGGLAGMRQGRPRAAA